MSRPWTVDQPPEAMRSLPPPWRRKALEIAHALLRQRMDEAKAIRIATAKVRALALHESRRAEQDGGP